MTHDADDAITEVENLLASTGILNTAAGYQRRRAEYIALFDNKREAHRFAVAACAGRPPIVVLQSLAATACVILDHLQEPILPTDQLQVLGEDFAYTIRAIKAIANYGILEHPTPTP